MKKITFTFSLLAIALWVGLGTTSAQEFKKLDASPLDIAAFPTSYKVSDKVVKITYSRPYKKGRDVYADLAPYGKVWRTGANEAPEITFYQDVKFGGKDVEAGTYSLFTIPNQDKWTVILNSDLNTWGAYTYKEANDVLRVEAPAQSSEEVIENFSIAFKEVDGGAHMMMGWDQTYVEVPVMFEK